MMSRSIRGIYCVQIVLSLVNDWLGLSRDTDGLRFLPGTPPNCSMFRIVEPGITSKEVTRQVSGVYNINITR